MGRKVRPIVKQHVAWSDTWEFTHGTHDGLPLLPHGWAPRHLLATTTQLKQMGKRPGGHDPVAVLYGYSTKGGCQWFASLYLISLAKPMFVMTPNKWRSIAKANLARRLCSQCGHDRGYIIPPKLGTCVDSAENPSTTNGNGVAA